MTSNSLTAGRTSRITRQIGAVGKGWKIFVTVMREIFDENAYSRFLQRTNARRSVASYGEFVREREVTAAGRARCC